MQILNDPALLSEHFREPSISSLRAIFAQANRGSLSDAEAASLRQALAAVLQDEARRGDSLFFGGLQFWKQSPGQSSHLIVAGELCAVITIYGVFPLLHSWMFQEGDLILHQIRWIEADHLVLFDLFYLLGHEKETVVCHYSPDGNAFVHHSAPERSVFPLPKDAAGLERPGGGKQPEIRFCLRCGRSISKEAELCPGCGNFITTPQDPDATLLHCLHCGQYIPPVSKFCPYCGGRVRR